MEELVDKIKFVLSPLLIALNRHDSKNELNYCVGGNIIIDSVISENITGPINIYLSDPKKENVLYKVLGDIGYSLEKMINFNRSFRSFNNQIDVYFLPLTPEQYVHNSEITIESGVLDNNFNFYCRPEFFVDLQKKNINVVNLNEPASDIINRINILKDKGFKYLKSSEKIITSFNRGGEYKKLLSPISNSSILTF